MAAFDAWTAAYGGNANILRENGEPALVRSVDVTPSFFAVFGARPLAGRLLVEGDYADRSVAVLTHAAWETMWGSDPELIGSTITVDSEPVTVAGVLSEDFTLPEPVVGRDAQIFRPVDWDDVDALDPRSRVFRVAVRLARGGRTGTSQPGPRRCVRLREQGAGNPGSSGGPTNAGRLANLRAHRRAVR